MRVYVLLFKGFGCEGPILSVSIGQQLILSSYGCDNLSKGEGILSKISGMEEKLEELNRAIEEKRHMLQGVK
jgi:hypothetical protein